MTKEDVRFYLDLKGALIHKFLNPDAFDFQFSTGSIMYEPTIFRWVKSTFQTLQSIYGIDYGDYMKIEEKEVLDKLVKNLGIDSRLKFLQSPELETEGFELPENFYQQVEQTAEAEKQRFAENTQAPISRMPVMPGGIPLPLSEEVEQAEEESGQQQNEEQADQQEIGGSTQTSAIPQMPSLPQAPQFPTTRTSLKPPKEGEFIEGKSKRGGFNFPKTSRVVSTAAKNAWTSTGTQFKKLTGKYFNPATLATTASTGIGAAVGGAVIGGPLGAVAGGGGGFALAKSIGSGGGGFFARLGNRAINFGTDFSNYFSRRQLMTLPKKSAIYFLLFLLFMMGMLIFLTGAGPISPPVGGGDISMCLFTRSDQSPPDVKIKSSTLVNLFMEAERTTSVPAKILAALARLESPGFVANAENDHDAFFNRNFTDITRSCAPHFGGAAGMSPTGALGLMQIQPTGTTGHFAEGVDYGARFFGKTVDTLTVADYCDVRKSILLAAGFTIKKLYRSYGIGDGTKWDPAWTNSRDTINKVAESYYGCLPYGGVTACTGPYNYGDDVWKSVSSCVVTTPTCKPVPAGDLRSAILSEYSITLDGFSTTQLGWAWEALSCKSTPNFLNYSKGTVFTKIAGFVSEQTGCKTINLGDYTDKTLFQVTLAHELGHIIYHCIVSSLNKKVEHNGVWIAEGGITGYAINSNTCYPGTIPEHEDYAEMVAYYLNPGVHEQTLCFKRDQAPFEGGRYPSHYSLAQNILGSLDPVPPPPPPPAPPEFSCPVTGGGRNILPSFQFDSVNGHCGTLYNAKHGFACSFGTNSRQAKSVDIETCINPRPVCQINTCTPLTDAEKANYRCGQQGKDIVLPSITGVSGLKWTRLNSRTLSSDDCFDYEILDPAGPGAGCGLGHVFKTDLGGGKNYVLHLVHMGPIDDGRFPIGGSFDPGTVIGKAQAIQVHITIGKDVADPFGSTESGWLPVDRNLNICNSQTNLGYR